MFPVKKYIIYLLLITLYACTCPSLNLYLTISFPICELISPIRIRGISRKNSITLVVLVRRILLVLLQVYSPRELQLYDTYFLLDHCNFYMYDSFGDITALIYVILNFFMYWYSSCSLNSFLFLYIVFNIFRIYLFSWFLGLHDCLCFYF